MPVRFFDNKHLSYDLQCLRSPEELRKIDLQKLIQKVVTINDPDALTILSKYVVFDPPSCPSSPQKEGPHGNQEKNNDALESTKTAQTGTNNPTVQRHCYVPNKYKHKLIAALMKYQYKQLRQTKRSKLFQGMPIPQPPPPRPDKNKSTPQSFVANVCVNYNWNNYCQAADNCNKLHVCSGCKGNHPARLCNQCCVLFNWAKCQKYCPHQKNHRCLACGSRCHAAWKCLNLSYYVKDRYYYIYKYQKIKKGFFAEESNKEAERLIQEQMNFRRKSAFSKHNKGESRSTTSTANGPPDPKNIQKSHSKFKVKPYLV